MKATLSIIILFCVIAGFFMVGDALAQDDAAPTPADEKPAAEAPKNVEWPEMGSSPRPFSALPTRSENSAWS